MSFFQSHSAFSAKFIGSVYLFSAAFLVALLAALFAMPDDLAKTILKEGGVVETLSALGYLAVVAYVLVTFQNRYLAKYHYLIILLLMFAMRELDFDKRFTELGILKSKFLVSEQVPLMQKIIGGMVLLLLVYVVALAIYKHFKPLLMQVFKPKAHTIGIYLGMFSIVFSKSLDGLQRKLQGFGFEVDNWLTQNASLIEEAVELFIPLFFFLAFWFYKRETANSADLRWQ